MFGSPLVLTTCQGKSLVFIDQSSFQNRPTKGPPQREGAKGSCTPNNYLPIHLKRSLCNLTSEAEHDENSERAFSHSTKSKRRTGGGGNKFPKLNTF